MSLIVYPVQEINYCVKRLSRLVEMNPVASVKHNNVFFWQHCEHLLELILGVYPALSAHDEVHILSIVAQALVKVGNIVKLPQ